MNIHICMMYTIHIVYLTVFQELLFKLFNCPCFLELEWILDEVASKGMICFTVYL